MTEAQILYWFHGDVCLNVVSSDNLPASDKPYVIDEVTDQGNEIRHRLKYNGHTRNIMIPKREQKDPKFIRMLHNAVHKFLEDERRESVKFITAGKHMYCTRKQHEKIVTLKKK